ncbi:MAG: hypothetical protein AB1668_04115 [Nanoarchaeota archaeon]
MLVQDKVLSFVRMNGPTLPSKVAKHIGTEILIASAYLSDLSAQGKLKISDLKVGGSPLYYLPGQESRLYQFVQGNINPKEIEVLERLKKEGVFREKNLDLLTRVALRSVKDFAIPLQVTIEGNKEIFWKWYLLSDEETNSAIARILSIFAEEEARKSARESYLRRMQEQELQPHGEKAEAARPKSELQKKLIPEEAEGVIGKEAYEEACEEAYSEKEEEIKSGEGPDEEAEAAEKPLVRKLKEKGTVKEKGAVKEVKVKERVKERMEERAGEKAGEKVVKERSAKEKEAKTKGIKKEEIFAGRSAGQKEGEADAEDISEESHRQAKEKAKRKSRLAADTFSARLENYFKELNIIVGEKEVIRKNSEINVLVKVPSVVGRITYFCKIKSKSKCDEKDISLAYMEAQIKKLPLLFLYTDDISSKAREMLDSGAFENAIVRKME